MERACWVVLASSVMVLPVGCLNPYAERTAPRIPRPGLEDRFSRFVVTLMKRRSEQTVKQRRVLSLMRERKLQAVVVNRPSNIAWLAAGDVECWENAQQLHDVKLVITPEARYLICPNSEADRLMDGPLNGLEYELVKYPWHRDAQQAVREVLEDRRVGSDRPEKGQVLVDVRRLCFPLTPVEMEKYRWLGDKAVRIVEYIGRSIERDMSDLDIQYLVAKEFAYWNVTVVTNHVTVDDRVARYPAGSAIGQKLRQHCSLRVCVRRWGLCVTLGRQIYLGTPPPALLEAFKKSAMVMAAVCNASKPGQSLGRIVDVARGAYVNVGAANAWSLHPLGGPIAYRPCLAPATSDSKVEVVPGMAMSWSTAVGDARCEDTIVAGADGTVEVLTACQDWPVQEVRIADTTYRTAGLLVR